MKTIAIVVAALVAVCTTANPAYADEDCSGMITRRNVGPCAVSSSLTVRGERQGREAAEGRRTAADTLLPSNPVFGASAGRRTSDQQRATNWYLTLGQEIELSGQRGLRRRAAEAEIAAQNKRIVSAEREAAAAAIELYFEALAADEELQLARRLEATGLAMATVTRARSEKGLLSPVDADVAEAVTLKISQLRFAAERRSQSVTGSLATALGRDPMTSQVKVDGDLAPLPGIDAMAQSLASRAALDRPDVQALEADRKAFELRADAYRRARIPNPTLQVLAQNDGFDERVYGVGVSFPIPLPQPVGRTYRGEIMESEALARQTATERDRLARQIQLEVTTALRAYESYRKEVEAFAPERLARAAKALDDIGREIEAGRIGLRDALITQQTLIELLRANIEARRALSIASVDLARAAGVALERGAQ